MICTYCGDIADTLDHVIPHSYTRKSAKEKRKYAREHCVPCCRECNSLLGNKLFCTVWARAEYLKKKYEKRYKKILSLPDWQVEDMDDMGHNMRQIIESSQRDKVDTLRRVQNCANRASLFQDILDIWEEAENRGDILIERGSPYP
jgi:hypothetical protein